MALTHRFVETNGIRLHCAVDGTDGPLVILLHGFPECWYAWRHQLAALAPRFRVVAPDLRGYNESDKPRGVAAYAMPELLADVAGLIQAFGERDAVIVGHDWGGGIAWNFAMEHPELTRRLVVMNAPHVAIFQEHLANNPQQLLKSWYMFFFQLPWLPETLLGANHAWSIGNMMRTATVRREAITAHDVATLRDAAAKPDALHNAINYYRAAFRSAENRAGLPAWLQRFWFGDREQPTARRTLADWPKIACPTLLIWGEQDVALRRELTYGMEPLFTGPLTIEYVPDSGHFVQEEKPALVNDLLLGFLGDLAAPAQPAAPAAVGPADEVPPAEPAAS